jgi:hypothetical protein
VTRGGEGDVVDLLEVLGGTGRNECETGDAGEHLGSSVIPVVGELTDPFGESIMTGGVSRLVATGVGMLELGRHNVQCSTGLTKLAGVEDKIGHVSTLPGLEGYGERLLS